MTELIPYATHDVPLLDEADAVVVGGSCGAVAAAEVLARSGWRVALVEPRTYLGREMSATLRPWLTAAQSDILLRGKVKSGAPLLHDFVAGNGLRPVRDEIPLSLHDLKLFLEDRLLAAGVQLFYASLPLAVSAAEGQANGLVIGNKSGRQLLRCTTLIDATANGLLAQLAGEQRATLPPETTAVYARTLEFDGVQAVNERLLSVPPELDLVNDRVLLHAGYRGADHVLVECRLRLPAAAFDPVACRERERRARQLSTRLAAYLMQEVPTFAGATFAAASHELYGTEAAPPLDEPPTWAEGDDILLQTDAAALPRRLPLAAFGAPLRNLWRLNETAHLPPPLRPALRDPVTACAVGTQLARRLSASDPPALPRPAAGKKRQVAPGRDGTPLTGARIHEPQSPQQGKGYERVEAGPHALPVFQETDVVVVGGGTSGATAAWVAARAGLGTALVEMNPGLGGTGTYGGVHSYWFGRRVGFAAQVTDLTVEMHELLRQPPPQGPVPRWNIEAKAQALRQATEDAGVDLFTNALVIGSVVEDGTTPDTATVRGVALATRQGPLILLGRVLIDASGDGDVAAHAGARTVYGAARDHVVMWYSLAQFPRPGRTRNNFTSMVDVSNVRDYTRAILAGRRRLRDSDHDHGIYVAPRESRHVEGDVTLTLSDQLLHRRWPDVVNVTFSNHDVKGHSTSDWVRLGLIPPNLEVEIPYRALLPRGLRNILVVGKALSATHDALPAIRMQADMENLGGAAALAAAYACRHNCDLRDVDITVVQEQLIAAGVLPPAVLERRLVPWRLQGAELRQQVVALEARPLVSYADMEMDEVYRQRLPPVDVCCAGPQAVPFLETEMARSQGDRRLLLAQLLSLLGSPAGVPLLVAHLQEKLAGETLPTRSSHIRYAGSPPDQGAMPQEVYLLNALGMARDRRALPVWERVVDLLAQATDDDVQSSVMGTFYYVEAVCVGAERLGHTAAIPFLERLYDYTPFHGLLSRHGFQEDFFAERRAYLELLIARAMARCGSPRGAAVLIDYLDDVRVLLARHAHSELVAIAGQDLGQETVPWSQWLEEQGEALAPTSYCRPTAPRRVWDEEILVADNEGAETEEIDNDQ